ncbi:hypothetical protein H0274_12505 [Altererythrobacter sp. CC-YST694]|uniref:hypothetical protein n=1 Tax=Altererythrobacter sp. CC-YST694 TaxID=2755038 RepID=UPI001D005F8F|nr:hypothetical protein [Altererythrobacter sp. CC-YST694]MCB5426082.1 hypothetical protein [Altererythrobacter sp. CC-YST694]
MKPLSALCAIALFALPAALSAESWEEVDRLPGDIAVELDRQSMSEAQDGTAQVVLASFRKQLPNGMMQTDVAMDCAGQAAKIRGIQLLQEGKVISSTPSPGADFRPVNYGSSEAIYYKALCGREIPLPNAGEGEAAGGETGE